MDFAAITEGMEETHPAKLFFPIPLIRFFSLVYNLNVPYHFIISRRLNAILLDVMIQFLLGYLI